MWLYGSGFPKSLNIGKAVDKKLGNKRKVIGEKVRGDVQKAKQSGFTIAKADANKNNKDIFGYGTETITKGNSEYEGWGTALKPAHEPIVLARKPVEGTVAENVLKHGTGGINIDDCRIEGEIKRSPVVNYPDMRGNRYNQTAGTKDKVTYEFTPEELTKGRFPANVMHDGSDEVLKEFPYTKSGKDINPTTENVSGFFGQDMGYYSKEANYGDEGSAARFFYCPKVSKSERNRGLDNFEEKKTSSMSGRRDPHNMEKSKIDNDVTGRFVTERKNIHPTVKPVELMKYLCRLVTPKGGIVLDPFMGSGTTGMAAKDEGFEFIGIEKEKEYFEIAEQRINITSPLLDFL
jgi:site-specific DNA-methyltransferase (adenine-specific)